MGFKSIGTNDRTRRSNPPRIDRRASSGLFEFSEFLINLRTVVRIRAADQSASVRVRVLVCSSSAGEQRRGRAEDDMAARDAGVRARDRTTAIGFSLRVLRQRGRTRAHLRAARA